QESNSFQRTKDKIGYIFSPKEKNGTLKVRGQALMYVLQGVLELDQPENSKTNAVNHTSENNQLSNDQDSAHPRGKKHHSNHHEHKKHQTPTKPNPNESESNSSSSEQHASSPKSDKDKSKHKKTLKSAIHPSPSKSPSKFMGTISKQM